MKASDALSDALNEHMRRYKGQIIVAEPTWASEEFDRLYLAWNQARWDEGHPWVRSVWPRRPT